MITVAIIAEYNPFHTGHEYQIKRIREEFGNDTRIIAIMSGNYTQRGDVAIMDKSTRAKSAVLCGVNLVLELPFPYSMSSAEFFAKSGVKIADSIGVVDYLSFGSERGDIDSLITVAKNMSTDKYKSALSCALKSKISKESGYPKLCEEVYNSLFPSSDNVFTFTPNNILALEYIKALLNIKSKIKPHTIKRVGASFSETKITADRFQSASAIRTNIFDNFNSASKYIPNIAVMTLVESYESGQFPCDSEKLSAAIISTFRLNPQPLCSDIHDAGGGLYNRLQKASLEANDIHTLTVLADTKKYTAARIRRAIWYSFFGVTSSSVKELPAYTQILAMDKVGKTILKEIKKVTDFSVITKPSSYAFLSDTARCQKILADKADSVFQLTKPKQPSGNLALKTTPYILK